VENEREKLEKELMINPKTLQIKNEFVREWYPIGTKARK